MYDAQRRAVLQAVDGGRHAWRQPPRQLVWCMRLDLSRAEHGMASLQDSTAIRATAAMRPAQTTRCAAFVTWPPTLNDPKPPRQSGGIFVKGQRWV